MPHCFDLRRRLFAETLGTCFLVAAVVGSGIMAEKLAGGIAGLALLCNTIPTGAILVVLITILGPVSGAHMNPAVSVAMAVGRELPRAELLPYVAAQILGGILGTLIAHLMFEAPTFQLATTVRSGQGQWLGELVATFGLLATILGCARFRPEAVPWGVGLYITAAYWFTSSTSFANPAVTMARALSDSFSGISLQDVPAFIAAQLAGALLATITFRWLLMPERKDSPMASIQPAE